MLITIPSVAAVAPTSREALDAALAKLQGMKQAWVALPIAKKVSLLEKLVQDTRKVASAWVEAAVNAKKIPADSPLAGEEWTSGPWALMYGANRYIETLQDIERTGSPQLSPGALKTRADGTVVAQVFPQSIYDTLLLNGITAEVWMEPGVTEKNLHQHMAAWYREKNPAGHVALVLGAGNIASIAPLDVLYKLLAEGQVCLLKMNPVNEYLGPFLINAFAGFIDAGYVAVAYGSADVGAYLTNHASVEEIHITGSAATHDAIVFGVGEAGAQHKAKNEPQNARRITSELGNVSPVIVVPGPWDKADLRYQAEHIATMKMHNGGFNCIAGQVLVLPKSWSRTDALTAEIEQVFKEIPNRAAYYPGAAARQGATVQAHPEAKLIDGSHEGETPRTVVPSVDYSKHDDVCFQTEAFGSVLSETRLPGENAREFLTNAVAFCNDTLWGTLGANILIHPETLRELGPSFEDALAQLKYGCIAVNAWTGVGFLLCQATWGAYPGHTLQDIRSGQGVVHNSYFFDKPLKSVIRQSFYPAPRALLHADFTLLPKPPWFVTNKTAATTGQRLVDFEAAPSPLKLPAIFASALRG
jgi:aldehyde dehydrogenase (NAD(P)+)